MFYLLSLISGILLSITILFNGQLSELYGLYSSSIIIHMTGLILISAAAVVKRERPFSNRQQWFLYMGGAIGLATLVFTNFAFGYISVSAILALGLLGQGVASLLVDRYGLMGMSKYPFHKGKLIGLLIVFFGIVSMITSFHFLAVTLAFAAGVTSVVARTLNGKLADLTSVGVSTFYNYFVGLGAAIIAFLVLGGGEAIYYGFVVSTNWSIYLGGAVGVVFIAISNYIVTKISAFSLSLFLFVGQVFSGILIDGLVLGEFSVRVLIGGILVAVGMCVDLFSGKKARAEG